MSPAGRLWLGWWWRVTRSEVAWAWGAWWLGGAPLMLAFLLGCAGVALVSGWPLLPPAPAAVPWALPAALACGWLLSGLGRSRPGLHPRGLEWAALRGPVAPAWTLAPALARAALPGALTGLALGAGLLVWSPALWPLALSLPWLGVGRALLHAARHGRRMAGQSGEGVTALAAGPLLGLLHPALLPVGAALAAVVAGVIWARTLADDLPPRLSAQLEVEAVRAGARRFGLPVPDVDADGYQPPRRWAPALRRVSPGGALWWRGRCTSRDGVHGSCGACWGLRSRGPAWRWASRCWRDCSCSRRWGCGRPPTGRALPRQTGATGGASPGWPHAGRRGAAGSRAGGGRRAPAPDGGPDTLGRAGRAGRTGRTGGGRGAGGAAAVRGGPRAGRLGGAARGLRGGRPRAAGAADPGLGGPGVLTSGRCPLSLPAG